MAYNTKYDVVYKALSPFITHNFLSEEEIDSIFNDDKLKFGMPYMTDYTSGEHYSDNDRLSRKDADLMNTEDDRYHWLVERLMKQVKKIIRECDFSKIDIDGISGVNLLKYEAGDRFDWHQDVNYGTSHTQRKMTMIIPLNTYYKDYTGGILKLADYIEHSNERSKKFPVKGSMITFPSYLQHTVTPITSGTRYAIVAWAAGPYWR